MVWSPWVKVTPGAGREYDHSEGARVDLLFGPLLDWGVNAYRPQGHLTREVEVFISPLHHPFRTQVPLFVQAGGSEAFCPLIKDFAQEMSAVDAAGGNNKVRFHKSELMPHDIFFCRPMLGVDSQVGLAIDDARKIIKGNPELERSLEGITDVRQLDAAILVDFLSNPHQSLESLVSSLSTFAVTDPRDTVYCLLNLAKEKIRTAPKRREYDRLEPDYEANLLQVYTRFVQWCVQESKSLDILCRHWASPELKHKVDIGNYPDFVKLPSWIKTVDNLAYDTQNEGYGGRRARDSFVGTPESRHYNASLGMGPTISYNMRKQNPERNNEDAAASPPPQRPRSKQIYWPKRPLLDLSSSITITGTCIGRIAHHSLMPNGIIPKQVLQNLGYESGETERETAPDILCRTLVADRGPDGKGPPSWYPRACKGCLTKNTESGHMDTNHILQRRDSTKLEVEFAKRVQAVCWNRAFIDCGKDVRGKLVGIGPADSRADDLICILYGLSVPCILRPTWRGGGNDFPPDYYNPPDYYKLIGEAFILGQMDGEALRYALWGADFCIM